MTLSRARLTGLLDRFSGLKIVLVGDLFLDRYLEIESAADEPSIETGLTAYQVRRVRNTPGALGTVMNNLAALGVQRLTPISVIGEDGHGFDLLKSLGGLPLDPSCIVQDPARLTPTYTKPMRRAAGEPWRELNRLDVRTCGPLSEHAVSRLLEHLQEAIPAADGVIVLDQINEENWGVVNQAVRDALAALAKKHAEKLFFVDSRHQLQQFPFGVLKGNRSEVGEAAGRPISDDASARAATLKLARQTNRPAFCTMGEAGLLGALPEGETFQAPGVKVAGPVDIVGAGDSATAALVASLLAGGSPEEAAEVANLTASITVQQLGETGTASPSQILARWEE